MPIQDTNAERKNLLIASIGFIFFFWGGGNFKGNSLKLPLLNIEFENTITICILIWCMLFWFAYRYWLKHSFEFLNDFTNELSNLSDRKSIELYISGFLSSPIVSDQMEGFHIKQMYWKSGRLYTDCFYSISCTRDKVSNLPVMIHGHASNHDTHIKFSGKDGWILAVRITGNCMYSKPSFSDYMVPYILFLLAIISGSISSLF